MIARSYRCRPQSAGRSARCNGTHALDYLITRYLPDGTRDSANFNPGFSYKTVDFMQPGGNDLGNAVALQSDRIITAGASLVSASAPANLDFSAVALLRERICANGFDWTYTAGCRTLQGTLVADGWWALPL